MTDIFILKGATLWNMLFPAMNGFGALTVNKF